MVANYTGCSSSFRFYRDPGCHFTISTRQSNQHKYGAPPRCGHVCVGRGTLREHPYSRFFLHITIPRLTCSHNLLTSQTKFQAKYTLFNLLCQTVSDAATFIYHVGNKSRGTMLACVYSPFWQTGGWITPFLQLTTKWTKNHTFMATSTDDSDPRN